MEQQRIKKLPVTFGLTTLSSRKRDLQQTTTKKKGRLMAQAPLPIHVLGQTA
jgi:6,7-dimethyl-8-ribityllumazine synthase